MIRRPRCAARAVQHDRLRARPIWSAPPPCSPASLSRQADPELWRAVAGRNRPPGRPHRADRLRELREPRGARGAGLGAHQQVRRGLSRQALLRRLRVRRHRRDSWRSSARRSCSAPTTRTSSRTRARRRTRPSTTAVLKPGDAMLGMSLAHGGHLTHGSPVNFSGKLYQAFSYGLDEREEIDYDAGRAPRQRAQAEADRHRRLRLLAA